MNDINITRAGDAIALHSPYHPTLPERAHRLGGRWKDQTKTWVFDARDERRVRDLCLDIFGSDGSPCALATVRLNVADHFTWGERERELYYAGRKIVARTGRDASVWLGSGVVLIEGDFPPYGGSVKNPKLDYARGATIVLEIRDLPLLAVENARKEGVVVIDTSGPPTPPPPRVPEEAELVAAIERFREQQDVFKAWNAAKEMALAAEFLLAAITERKS